VTGVIQMRAMRASLFVRRLASVSAVAVTIAVSSCVSMRPSGSLSQRPSAPQNVGVTKGSGALTKTAFLSDPGLGSISDLVWSEKVSSPGAKLCVAGSRGAAFADAKGTVLSSVAFVGSADRVTVVDGAEPGGCRFLNRGSWGEEVRLFSHDGKVLWTYGGDPGVDDAACGDVDGDGRLEFVVGFNGGGGVHLLDSQGRKRWEQPDGNVWHVEIGDIDGDGRQEIIHSCAAGEMVVRDRDGKVLRRSRPPGYFDSFALCHWPDREGPLRVVWASAGSIYVLDSGASPVAELSAPDLGDMGDICATPVKLRAGEPSFFATVVSFRRERRTVLYVHDHSRGLIYQEVLAEPCSALVALPAEGAGGEALLLGGSGGQVWRYAAGAGAP